ncbi:MULTISPECIES: hypothetical protein [Propionimicrobium]|uniref:Lipoprotein n=1 Tax=Propionimicrobium lymphophilum ACS-093-V-SCH5 TaxID=883161 RepID=S2W4S3_9ACTN|nr:MULTISPECIES: hypothetical protein [Propionimicrobium]EPD33260.1 hypothetical protein HMPREF9306_00793 [Propionimicrobium lymphophilum ACS-093-V-SCH5]MDK7710044.1 hypothetical protein [Propionimicrobium lymphophilum]
MKLRFRATICLVSLASLLTGCAGASGMAAQVGDNKIDASDVTKLQQGCEQASQEAGERSGVSKYEMINWLVSGKIGQEVAKVNDISVSESEQLDFLRAQNPAVQVLMNNDQCRSGLMDVAYFSQVMTKLQASGQRAVVPNIEVKVNPRFGKWDANRNMIIDNPGVLAGPPESYLRDLAQRMQQVPVQQP